MTVIIGRYLLRVIHEIYFLIFCKIVAGIGGGDIEEKNGLFGHAEEAFV